MKILIYLLNIIKSLVLLGMGVILLMVSWLWGVLLNKRYK